MLQRPLLLLFLLLSSIIAVAQQDPFMSLNRFSQMFYNPGYAGDGNEIEAKLLNRNQWMGFGDGVPNNFIANIDAPFKLFGHRHGAGLSLIRDNIGGFSNTGVNISYAYRRGFIQGDLGIGIALNMISHEFYLEKIVTSGGDVTTDILIPTTGNNDRPMIFDMNLGLYYSADNMYFSVSARNLLGSNINYYQKEPVSIRPKVYLGGGYNYQLTNPLFSVEPIVFLATDIATTEFNLSSLVYYNKLFFGGLGIKTNTTLATSDVIALAGFKLLNGIQVALSYDISLTKMISYNSGSFEFMLGYSFNLDMDKDIRKYKSIRFL